MSETIAIASEDRLRLTLIGGFRASVADEPVDLPLLRAQGLLGYLSLEGGAIRREYAQALLWNGDETESAKLQARLKQVLHKLSKALAHRHWGGYQADRQSVILDLAHLDSDIGSVFTTIERLGYDERLISSPAIFDTLLAGLDTISDEFALWLTIKRRQLSELAVRKLEVKLAENRDPHRTLAIARALMSLDPTHEVACRSLMTAFAAAGEPIRALRYYDDLWRLLDEEYDGIRPAEETQALAVKIKLGEPVRTGDPNRQLPAKVRLEPPPTASPVPAAMPKPRADEVERVRILVAPARFSGQSDDRAYLVRGFRELFVSSLVRFREWRILDVSNAERIARADGEPQSFLLTIAGIELGESVEIILSFKNLSTDDLIWSEQFSATSTSWPAVQKKVIHRMATALNLHLSAERLAATYMLEDFELPVFDSWLRGQELLLNYRGRDWDRAVALFRNVLERAPRFGRAYSSLSQLENGRHLYFPGVLRSRWRHQKAHEYAVEATRIDPIDSRAQLALGWSHAMLDRYERAELTLGHAFELNQNDPWTIVSVGLGWAFAGEIAEARKLADLALEIGIEPSPTHWGYQATLRFLCGDYRGALDACENADHGRAFLDLPAWKAATLVHLGDRDGARASMEEFLSLARESWALPKTPSDNQIAHWFLQCFPIRTDAARSRLWEGVAEAGLPATLLPPEPGPEADQPHRPVQ